jgi:hypothetical protein
MVDIQSSIPTSHGPKIAPKCSRWRWPICYSCSGLTHSGEGMRILAVRYDNSSFLAPIYSIIDNNLSKLAPPRGGDGYHLYIHFRRGSGPSCQTYTVPGQTSLLSITISVGTSHSVCLKPQLGTLDPREPNERLRHYHYSLQSTCRKFIRARAW